MSHQSTPQPARVRRSFPLTTVVAAFCSAIAFAGCTVLIERIGGRLSADAAWGILVLALASILTPFRGSRVFALLLLWNGLGVVLASLLLGITGSGAIMIFPVVLIALALSSAPSEATAAIATWPAVIVLICGFVAAIIVAEYMPSPTWGGF